MTKDVLLAIKGMQFGFNETTEESEDIEVITSGRYFEKGDHAYLMYDEILEGFSEPVSNLIRFSDSAIEVTKKGMINVHMVFEEGKQNLTDYQTPYGNIVIGINTHKVEVRQEKDVIHLSADYGLDINYEFLSDCRISLDISPKEGAEKSL